MVWVVEAQALPNYRLRLRFSDEVVGEVDLSEFVANDARPIVRELRDLTEFAAICVESDTVAWQNGSDLAPEYLRANLCAVL